jgi:hypothetical protein
MMQTGSVEVQMSGWLRTPLWAGVWASTKECHHIYTRRSKIDKETHRNHSGVMQPAKRYRVAHVVQVAKTVSTWPSSCRMPKQYGRSSCIRQSMVRWFIFSTSCWLAIWFRQNSWSTTNSLHCVAITIKTVQVVINWSWYLFGVNLIKFLAQA